MRTLVHVRVRKIVVLTAPKWSTQGAVGGGQARSAPTRDTGCNSTTPQHTGEGTTDARHNTQLHGDFTNHPRGELGAEHPGEPVFSGMQNRIVALAEQRAPHPQQAM